MGQERLSLLALLSFERELSTSCNYDAVIDNFADMKNRRKKFLCVLILGVPDYVV